VTGALNPGALGGIRNLATPRGRWPPAPPCQQPRQVPPTLPEAPQPPPGPCPWARSRTLRAHADRFPKRPRSLSPLGNHDRKHHAPQDTVWSNDTPGWPRRSAPGSKTGRYRRPLPRSSCPRQIPGAGPSGVVCPPPGSCKSRSKDRRGKVCRSQPYVGCRGSMLAAGYRNSTTDHWLLLSPPAPDL
jgi:hypothetical protein